VYETRLGKFEIKDNEIVTFPQGIPGFEHLRRFAVVSFEETKPICWLVSLEDETVALPIIDPWLIENEYEVELSEDEMKILQVNDPSDVIIWSVVTIPNGKPEQTTVNLKAPIVINLKSGLGMQIILDKYDLKHPIANTTQSERAQERTEERTEKEA
jgi:flagellar assembly factor FliW